MCLKEGWVDGWERKDAGDRERLDGVRWYEGEEERKGRGGRERKRKNKVAARRDGDLGLVRATATNIRREAYHWPIRSIASGFNFFSPRESTLSRRTMELCWCGPWLTLPKCLVSSASYSPVLSVRPATSLWTNLAIFSESFFRLGRCRDVWTSSFLGPVWVERSSFRRAETFPSSSFVFLACVVSRPTHKRT